MTTGSDAFTTIHFVLMALLAVAVIAAIGWGVKLKRGRVAGQKEFEAHAEEAGVEINQPEPEGPSATELAPPPTPVPVAPAPPPIADRPIPAAAAPEPVAEPEPTVEARPDAISHSEEAPEADPLADEPIAAAIAPDGTSVTLTADAMRADDGPDPADGPITDIKGLGPRVAARLGELGIDRVGQLAALDDAAAADLDAHMGPFTGRLARDRWIEQARLLAAGDRDGFERAFGKLG